MAKIDERKIMQMFDYLSDERTSVDNTDGAIVFGRADPRVAKRAASLYHNQSGYLLFTGGIGKDSGILTEFQIPEAYFLAAIANSEYQVPRGAIYLEPRAANGADCCRFSLDKIAAESLPHDNLTLVAHSTSLRRLDILMKNIIAKEKPQFASTKFERVGTNYPFDAHKPLDQREAVAELLRVADWPAIYGWNAAEDLPQDLVDYAREIKEIL